MKLFYTLLITIFIFQTNSMAINATDNPVRLATPVFSSQAYHCVFPYRLNPRHKDGARLEIDEQVPVISFGTGFFVNSLSGPLLITAKHNCIKENPDGILIDENRYLVDDSDESIKRVSGKIRISGLAIEPERILIDDKLDLAILQISNEMLDLVNAKILKQSDSTLALGTDVQMIGYPPAGDSKSTGTPDAPYGRHQLVIYQIAYLTKGELTLNGGLDDSTEGGFSGGPVLSPSGEVIGMVIRADEKQTRCIRITEIMKRVSAFDEESTEYKDFNVSE